MRIHAWDLGLQSHPKDFNRESAHSLAPPMARVDSSLYAPAELVSCVKVEVAVLGSPSLMVLIWCLRT